MAGASVEKPNPGTSTLRWVARGTKHANDAPAIARDTAWAMSEENVEIVRRVTAEFTESHKVSSERVAPDSIWDMRSWPSWSGQPQFHGRDGFIEFFAEWTGAYEEWDQEIEDIIDAGDNQVLEINRQRGRLRGSDSWVALCMESSGLTLRPRRCARRLPSSA
jgi:hypothetical protein